MYALQYTDSLPSRALVVSHNEASMRTDINTLRSLGVSSFVHKNALPEALAWLKRQHASSVGNAVDIVLCDEFLQDAPAAAFLNALAQSPELRSQPVLVLSGSPKVSRPLRATGAYILERPYTPAALLRMVRKATSPVRRTLDAETVAQAAREKGLKLTLRPPTQARKASRPVTTSDLFYAGIAQLEKGEAAQARLSFLAVLRRQDDHVEALLGLAKAERLLGNKRSLTHALVRASAASLRQEDKLKSAAIASLLPVRMRDNIYASEAVTYMENEDYRRASLSFLDAAKHDPAQALHAVIARSCSLTKDPEQGMRELCHAMDGLGYAPLAKHIRKRLLEYDEYEPGPQKSSWLDSYPKLKEFVDVVVGTATAWRALKEL